VPLAPFLKHFAGLRPGGRLPFGTLCPEARSIRCTTVFLYRFPVAPSVGRQKKRYKTTALQALDTLRLQKRKWQTRPIKEHRPQTVFASDPPFGAVSTNGGKYQAHQGVTAVTSG